MGYLVDPDYHECCENCSHCCMNDGADVKGSLFKEFICDNEDSENYGQAMDSIDCCDEYEAE